MPRTSGSASAQIISWMMGGTTATSTAFGRHGTRLYVGYAQSNRVAATAAILITLAGAWIGSFLLGGSHSPGPHLFYVAIALAAVRFEWPGAVVAGLAGGLLAGPLLPADVDAMTQQTAGEWLLRSAVFLALGIFIAVLVEGPHATFTSRLHDAAVSARLSRALDNGEIEVFYQPIFQVVDGQPAAVEALVRWRKSPGRYIPPDEFLPSAERTGAISRVDMYVLEQAVTAVQQWADAEKQLTLSVNFSAVTLARPDLPDAVRRLLERRGFSPTHLEVEITESALAEDLPTAIHHVRALRALGVKIAIDDFGSGHASLNYLHQFQADVVKLDRSLLTAASIDERSRRLLEGIVDLCARLEMHVIAEGVETDDQLALVRQANVPMVQGFLFGRPVSHDDVRAQLS